MVEPGNGAHSDLMISEENILVRAVARSREDIIQQLGQLLEQHGLVRETYVQAVLDREKVFPTGLQTSLFGFAIPHTDTAHVLQPAVAIATLREPVMFQAMDNPDMGIPVTVVMMLAISDPKAVVTILRQVISILEDQDALEALARAATTLEIREIVYNHIQKAAQQMSNENTVEISHA